MKVFVVIATYNERENIGSLIDSIFGLPIPGLNIIVVDDNSSDGTAASVKEKLDYSGLHVVVRTVERGYGSAHVRGFQEALGRGADVIVTMDADWSHQPTVIPAMLEQIRSGYDVVIGSRRIAGGQIIGWGLFRKLASRTAMILVRLVLGVRTHDVTTGFRAYSAAAIRRLDVGTIKSNGYSFLEELIFRCERRGLKIKEIPITFQDRQLGKSKFSFKEIIKFFITLFKLRFNLK